jgi:hypothetical protein
LTEKTKLDFDKKNTQLRVEENKKKDGREHSTAANPPPKAHAQKAQRRRVCGSANVL